MLLLNKSDLFDPARLLEWVGDYEKFLEALQEDPSYLATLSKSIVIHLSEFFELMKYTPISAKTGQGFQQILPFIHASQQPPQQQ